MCKNNLLLKNIAFCVRLFYLKRLPGFFFDYVF